MLFQHLLKQLAEETVDKEGYKKKKGTQLSGWYCTIISLKQLKSLDIINVSPNHQFHYVFN